MGGDCSSAGSAGHRPVQDLKALNGAGAGRSGGTQAVEIQTSAAGVNSVKWGHNDKLMQASKHAHSLAWQGMHVRKQQSIACACQTSHGKSVW